jgi:hypothetical protein
MDLGIIDVVDVRPNELAPWIGIAESCKQEHFRVDKKCGPKTAEKRKYKLNILTMTPL